MVTDCHSTSLLCTALRPVDVVDSFRSDREDEPLVIAAVEGTPRGAAFLQPRACSQRFLVSSARTQKMRKMKNPWKELQMAKAYWKMMEASLNVNAPKTHVSPNRVITPKILSMARKAPFLLLVVLVLSLIFLLVCLIRTNTTMKKIAKLKSMTAKIGPRNAPKNT